MEPTFPPPVIMPPTILPYDAPLPPWQLPHQTLVEPVQRIGDLSLTMPLSANMDLVREIASLAVDPTPYGVIFCLSVFAIGLALTLDGRPPSFAAVNKTISDAVLFAGALVLVSMISPLPIGYAILLPGLLATVGAAMFVWALLAGVCELVVGWVSRWAAAKPALHRSNALLHMCFLFTRPWFRRLVLAVGVILIGIAIRDGFLFGTALPSRFLPLGLLAAPFIAASLAPRSAWRSFAHGEFRCAKFSRDNRARPSTPVTPNP